jgi:hypothetical protein
MTTDALMGDRVAYKDVNGRERWFVCYRKESKTLLSWQQAERERDTIEMIDVPSVTVTEDTLKILKVWDELSEDEQNVVRGIKIEDRVEPLVQHVGEKAERGDEMSESESVGNAAGVAESPVVRKRGRKPSAELAGIPRKLACACGTETIINPRQVIDKAKAANQTVQEYIAAWKCRTCRKNG